MRRPSAWAIALMLAVAAARAQDIPSAADWKEAEVAPPPPVRTDRLIPLEMPASTLRFGVDPASVALSGDGVVRYVVVATSTTGAVNAFYEGIRCSTAETKLYARHTPDSGWVPVADSQWLSLHDNRPSRHSLAIARTGACIGRSPNRSVAQIVRDLGGGVNWRFWNN